MAQCSAPISPGTAGPSNSAINNVEQEKEKPAQESGQDMFEEASEEYLTPSENYLESVEELNEVEREEFDHGVSEPLQIFDDSDSEDGLDVVYGPQPPPAARMRPMYSGHSGQDCAPSNTSSICTRQQPSGRTWNHEPGDHYSYCPTYSRRVHHSDYYQYDPPPLLRQSRYISVRDWRDPGQSSQSSSGRYPGHSDPYELRYPPILRHPTRHRHRRHAELEHVSGRIPYHARPPPVEIDMDYLDYDHQPPATSLASESGMRNMRHEQQRQVIMRHASTSTPPIPSLRQHASTSTSLQQSSDPPPPSAERKREAADKEQAQVPDKRAKTDETTPDTAAATNDVSTEAGAANIDTATRAEQDNLDNNTDTVLQASSRARTWVYGNLGRCNAPN